VAGFIAGELSLCELILNMILISPYEHKINILVVSGGAILGAENFVKPLDGRGSLLLPLTSPQPRPLSP